MSDSPHIPITQTPSEIPPQPASSETVMLDQADSPPKSMPIGHSWNCDLSFVVGEKDAAGRLITEVIHTGAKCVVFLTEGPGVGWHVDDTECVDAQTSIAEACDLIADLRTVLTNRDDVLRSLRIIAACLARALNQRYANDCTRYFVTALEFVSMRRREALQIQYLSAAALTAILVAAAALTSALFAPDKVMCATVAAGAVGALVSVSQRFRSIPIDRYASSKYTVVAGITRIAFGSLFAIGFLVLQRAGLVLEIAAGKTYLLITGAVVAGFSERLFPELLQRFETQFSAENK